jgi:hypothetical protein
MVAELLDRPQASGLTRNIAHDRLVFRDPRPAGAFAEQLPDGKPGAPAAPAPFDATPPPPPLPTCGPPTLPFDPAEAAALLARLDIGLKAIEATYPGARFPDALASAANLITETCRSYVEDRGWWEARHCDPMTSLREAVPFWLWEAWRLWGREPLTMN